MLALFIIAIPFAVIAWFVAKKTASRGFWRQFGAYVLGFVAGTAAMFAVAITLGEQWFPNGPDTFVRGAMMGAVIGPMFALPFFRRGGLIGWGLRKGEKPADPDDDDWEKTSR
jgi:hypothetical protein